MIDVDVELKLLYDYFLTCCKRLFLNSFKRVFIVVNYEKWSNVTHFIIKEIGFLLTTFSLDLNLSRDTSRPTILMAH